MVISEREIEIKNSMGIIYCEIGQLEQGIDHFEDALKLLTRIKHIKDYQIEIRLYYNLAKTYTSLEKWNDALVYCEKAIRQCIHHSTLYSFGELYYQQGECLLKIGDKSKGEQSLKKAISIFELIGNESFANETRKLLNMSI
ncbi:tetratricopeptide repeat protein [Microaerobacter geothermalis]|uniref:tetratricopeptide repeat protein n=1 Tax=Microaerobacter geothermalis TaxID=674972 RepID=UPI001F4359F2|nr:tetratricopeptide repeat protein [Microaerobacter geothermalis]